jgi:hypothetical protein
MLILLREGAFREGTFEGRSRGGACERTNAPAPGRLWASRPAARGHGGRCFPCTGLPSKRVTPAVQEAQEAWPGAEPRMSQFLARAAAERRKASAPRKADELRTLRTLVCGARRARRHRQTATFVGAARHWLDAPLGAPLPLLSPGANLCVLGGGQSSDTTVARAVPLESLRASRAARARAGLRRRGAPRNHEETPGAGEGTRTQNRRGSRLRSGDSLWHNLGPNASREQ